MNEPFLLSNLIELQEIDNKIYKLEVDKKGSENVERLMALEANQEEQPSGSSVWLGWSNG